MPEQLQAKCESIFHVRNPQESRRGENGCLRYLRRISSYAARADLWPGLPSEILTCEKCGVKVRGERGLKIHLQQWCGQSAHDEQTASRLETRTETQGVERVKKWPCSYCQKGVLHSLMSSPCRNRPPRALAQHQSPLSVNTRCRRQHREMTPAIEATSAQLQVDGKRSDGDNLLHGRKQPLKRKGTPKDLDKAASEIAGKEKRSEDDQLRLVSVGANSVAFSPAAIAACQSVKLNLESEHAYSVGSGPKDYISEVRESSLWASIQDYLTPLDVLSTRTAGLKWNCAKLTKDGSEEGAQPEWQSLCLDHRRPWCHAWSMQESGESCAKGTCYTSWYAQAVQSGWQKIRMPHS